MSSYINKKFKTAGGLNVKLHEQIDDILYGMYENAIYGWLPACWKILSDGHIIYIDKSSFSQNVNSILDLFEKDDFEINLAGDYIYVNYFGHWLYVGSDIKYIATDADWRIWGFSNIPSIGNISWYDPENGTAEMIKEVDIFGNWKKSLKEIK